MNIGPERFGLFALTASCSNFEVGESFGDTGTAKSCETIYVSVLRFDSSVVECVNMTVIPTAKPTTVITTDELSTVKDTVTRARLRADFYRHILSSQCDHKLTAT